MKVTMKAMDKTHVQVIERLKKDIEQGVWKENERLPSDFELVQRFEVSRSVVRKALEVLESEKLIIRKHGVGTFVNTKPLFTSGIEELSSVSKMIREAGMTPGTIFMDVSTTDSSDDDIERFDFTDEDHLVTIKRVRTADDEPVVYCVDQVLTRNFPIGTDEILSISLFDAIEKSGEIRIAQAVANIEPVAYDIDASSILRCGVDVPLLVLSQRHYSEEGEMVLYSRNYFRADKFNFHVVRKRVY